MEKPTIEEVLELVSFERDENGKLQIDIVYGDVKIISGNVGGVYGDVRVVKGSVSIVNGNVGEVRCRVRKVVGNCVFNAKLNVLKEN